MEEHKRQLSLLLLMVVLVAVNMVTGGPYLPKPSPETAVKVVQFCFNSALFLGIILLCDWAFCRIREHEKAERLAREASARWKATFRREEELRKNPNVSPETYAEQIKRKKGLR